MVHWCFHLGGVLEARPYTVLMVGERARWKALRELLEPDGRVLVAASPEEAVTAVNDQNLDAILVAVSNSEDVGTLSTLCTGEGHRDVPVIAVCEAADPAQKPHLWQLGVSDVLDSPWDPLDVRARVERCVRTKRRMDELHAEAANLQQLSITDGLTQIYNRRFFQERLKEEYRRAQRYDASLALIMMDLDHFKSVNDRFGHLAGDQVLREVANTLRASVRETDLLSRYGGEEFAVILPQTQLSGAMTVAERVARGLASVRLSEETPVRISASIGIAGYPGWAIGSAEQLVRAADEALYQAKRAGRDRIYLYAPVEGPDRKTTGGDPARSSLTGPA